MDTLERDIERLSPELRREVEDFVGFLLTKHVEHAEKPVTRLKLDWRGGLSELKDTYDAVGLQHQASRWRE